MTKPADAKSATAQADAAKPARPQPASSGHAPRERAASGAPLGYFAVGRIVGVHGLKGEVKVESHSDYPDRFAAGATLALGDELEPLTVRASRPHKGHVLVTFVEIADRTDAETLRGEWLFVPEHAAADLGEDTYWVHEIVGLRVFTEAGEPLGRVVDVLHTGANDVYIVQRKEGKADLLLPAIDAVVRSVDVAARRMTVHLIDGLAD